MAHLLVRLLLAFLFVQQLCASKKDSKGKVEEKPLKKKDVRDYTDADIERLYEQWEESDEDELEPDELPEWKREPPKVDMSQFDSKKPEEFMKQSKKGRTLMMFATVAGDPTEKETERISSLWHSSLFNANIQTERFVVGSNRVLFMCSDGALAWEIKDFLVTQDNCDSVEIEGQTFTAKGGKSNDTKQDKKTDDQNSKAKKASKNDAKKSKKEKSEL